MCQGRLFNNMIRYGCNHSGTTACLKVNSLLVTLDQDSTHFISSFGVLISREIKSDQDTLAYMRHGKNLRLTHTELAVEVEHFEQLDSFPRDWDAEVCDTGNFIREFMDLKKQ